MNSYVGFEEFASYWGLGKNELPMGFAQYFDRQTTAYREAEKDDLEDYLDYFLKKVTKRFAIRSSEDNRRLFEEGWRKCQQRLRRDGLSLEALIPDYYNNARPYYLGPDGRMHVTADPLSSARMQILYMRYLALSVFRPFRFIHEFGSGSGLNLLAIASVRPDAALTGYEWTDSGAELAGLIGEMGGYAVSGRKFDLTRPDYLLNLDGQAVLTAGVIEQLEGNYNHFIEFLLAKKPAVAVHLELDGPEEDDDSVYARLGSLYLKMRGYSLNFVKTLKGLEAEGKISIIFSRPLPWVTSFCDLKCIIWKPL